MTIVELDLLIDLIEERDLDIVKKIIVSEECFEELKTYKYVFGGDNKIRFNSLYYRNFKIMLDK